jgi:hypothetical protein
MRKITCAVVVAVFVVAMPAAAAIQYEFFQKSSSDASNTPAADVTGRALIDGARSRVDFIGGSMYPPGTYVVSTDGARTLRYVDPINHSYTEVSTRSLASAIGTANLKIDNIQSSVTKLADRPIIAGVPADHYRMTITYEITVTMANMPLTQSIRTVVDRWTTVAFGEVGSAMGEPMLTGNAKADELIAIETTKIKGFPLREVVTITSTNPRHKAVPGSKLQLPATRTRVRETLVTEIREARPTPSSFTIPANYQKFDVDNQQKQEQVHQVTLEPTGE